MPVLLLFGNPQLFQLRRDIRAGGVGFHLVVDEEDFPVLADIERPARSHLSIAGSGAVRLGDGATRIAQDRVIGTERFRKLLVCFRVVATGGEIGHVELADIITALTERFAFCRSATGDGPADPPEKRRVGEERIEERVLVVGGRPVDGHVTGERGWSAWRLHQRADRAEDRLAFVLRMS